MLTDPTQQNVIARLKRVEGQVRGIRRMVIDSRPSVDILQQLAAADAALDRVRQAVVKHHVECEVPEAFRRGGPDQETKLAELLDIFERYAR